MLVIFVSPKSLISWNLTLLHLADFTFLHNQFSVLSCDSAVFMPWLVRKTSRFGLKYLFWSPWTGLEMSWGLNENTRLWSHRGVAIRACERSEARSFPSLSGTPGSPAHYRIIKTHHSPCSGHALLEVFWFPIKKYLFFFPSPQISLLQMLKHLQKVLSPPAGCAALLHVTLLLSPLATVMSGC